MIIQGRYDDSENKKKKMNLQDTEEIESKGPGWNFGGCDKGWEGWGKNDS